MTQTERQRRRTPAEALARALVLLSGGQGRITRHTEANWASITFAGTRHNVDLVFEGEAAIEVGEDFIADLPEHNFKIPGALVADAMVTKVDHRTKPPRVKVSCEMLLVEEG